MSGVLRKDSFDCTCDALDGWLRGNDTRKRWGDYFEELLNVQEDREADIVAVGGVQVPVMKKRMRERLQ